jgi:hypothetical protein
MCHAFTRRNGERVLYCVPVAGGINIGLRSCAEPDGAFLAQPEHSINLRNASARHDRRCQSCATLLVTELSPTFDRTLRELGKLTYSPRKRVSFTFTALDTSQKFRCSGQGAMALVSMRFGCGRS